MSSQTTAAPAPSRRPANDHPTPDGARPLNASYAQTDPEPPPGGGLPMRPIAAPCKDCGTVYGFVGRYNVKPQRKQGYCCCCYQRHQRARDIPFGPAIGGWRCRGQEDGPFPIPAGQSPILRPDRDLPVWTGLALVKYPAPTWHTYRPEDRHISRSTWERQLGKAA